MKIIGYMEGTDPDVLTHLLIKGYETLPMSNGYDNHGKNITLLTTQDNLSLLVGYLHKFIPIAFQFTLNEMLSSVRINKIPLLFIVPRELHEKADELVAEKGIDYRLADPSELTKAILEMVES